MEYKRFLLVAAVLTFGWFLMKGNDVAPPPPQDTDDLSYQYGEVVLEVGKKARFPHLDVTALEITEDSRCAEGLQCVWAGTVKVKVDIAKESGNFTKTFELGKLLTTGTENVELIAVAPYPKAGESISRGDYRLTFKITLKSEGTGSPGAVVGTCFVGGCSGQICSEEPGAISTCEFRAEYACYKTAKCERQTNGQCGWTETPTLRMCLDNAN